jgi:hypothetical protein
VRFKYGGIVKFCLILVFLIISGVEVQAQWEEYTLPVFGGRFPISHQSYSFASLGHYLFCSSDIGVYISEDSGLTWSARNNGLSTLNVTAIGSCGNSLFAGTTSDFYRSKDTGRSWQLLFTAYSSVFKSRVKRIFTHGQNIYVVNDRLGVFRSTDGGENWGDADAGLSTKSVLSVCANDSFIFVGTTDGVFRSSDYGSKWVAVHDSLATPTVTALTAENRFVYRGCYTSTKGSLFYSSSSNGLSWDSSFYVSSGSSGAFGQINDILAVDSFVIIAPFFSSSNPYLDFSTDNGKHWLRLDSNTHQGIPTGPQSPNSLFLFNGYLFATRDGAIFRRSIRSLSEQASFALVENQISEIPFPNPATTFIKIPKPRSMHSTAWILNQLGQQVESLQSNNQIQTGHGIPAASLLGNTIAL